ncbi:MAG: lysophospholipase, partial [Cyanobacteria bacterium]|nr:lysophospholipase [Cyanobacteriota bacterium]
GGCLDGTAFSPLAKRLSKQDYTFVSFDMRGFGQWYHDGFGSKKHNRTFRYDETRADIVSILKRLRQQYPRTPIVCMGESLGANMAMAIAGTHPDLVDGTILCSPYCGPQFILYPQMLQSLGHFLIHPLSELDMSPYLLRRLAHERHMSISHINSPRNRDQQSALELIRSWRLNKFGMDSFLNIPDHMPILVLVGECDRLCKPEDSAHFFGRINSQNCQYTVLPGQGHLMVETEFLDSKILSKITDWLDESQRLSIAKKEAHPAKHGDARHKQGLRELNTFAFH